LYVAHIHDILERREVRIFIQEVLMDKRNEIEQLAYELYQRDGCAHGREVEHWLEAERIVQSRYAVLVIEKTVGLGSAAPQAAKTASKVSKTVRKSKTVPGVKSAKKSPAKGTARKTGTARKKSSL
jgi:hypothetical protein